MHAACCGRPQLRCDLQEYGGGLHGHVRVFANTTAVTDFLPEILPGFLSGTPRVNIDLQEKPNAEIARGVLDGRADIGIVAGKVDTLGLQAIHFSTGLPSARVSALPKYWTKTPSEYNREARCRPSWPR